MSQLGLILQTGLIIYLLIFFPQNTQDSNPEMLRTFQLWIFEECPFKKGTVYYYLVWFTVFRETPQICSLSPVRHHNTLSPCHKAGSVVKALVYQKVGGSRHSTASLPLLWPWAWPLRGCVSQLTLCSDPNKLGYMGGGSTGMNMWQSLHFFLLNYHIGYLFCTNKIVHAAWTPTMTRVCR